MAINTRDSTCLPLKETIVHNNNTARAIELVILSLLVSLLIYRVGWFKDQDNYVPWLLAFMCESWFTFTWILSVNTKWNQHTTITYPERLLNRVSESEFPAVDIFVTTADPILEPCIITMNTVLSLLAVNYPANKLALYLSDDGCSPLTFYSLVETTKFAKLWAPFCKKYNVQVRAPFRYFTPKSTPLQDDSLEFQQEWKKMKNEYGDLYKRIKLASQKPFTCDRNSDFGVFRDVHRSNHPAIIKAKLDVLKQQTGKILKVINFKAVFAPSTTGALVGFVIGTIPPIRRLLIGTTAPLRVIQDSATLIGGAAIPTVTLIVGGNLLKGLRGSGISLPLVFGIAAVRYIFLPLFGILIVKGAIYLGLVHSNPLYVFVLLLQFALPPAMNIATITQLFGAGETDCSVIMLWTYGLASISLTLWSTFFMWLVA